MSSLTSRLAVSPVSSPGVLCVGDQTDHCHMEPATHTAPYSSVPVIYSHINIMLDVHIHSTHYV